MPVLHIGESVFSKLHDIETSGFRHGSYPFPDFLIVGPQRTGSSWLRTNLCKHPQVFMPFKKEIFFFSHLRRTNHKRYRSNRLEDYCDLFRIRFTKKLERFGKALCHGLLAPNTIRGEATASYATMPEPDIANIFAIHPAIRIVIIVRDPVERSWSHAKKTLVRDRNLRIQDVPFQEFEDYYRSGGNIARGTCSAIIDRWRSFAQEAAVFVAEYRRLAEDPLRFLTEIQEFLGIASGKRFARRHLHAVVNPTAGDAVPERHERFLRDLFSTEIATLRRDHGIRF